MNFVFAELRCPICGSELDAGQTTIGQDVQMVKVCKNRFDTEKPCEFQLILIVTNKDFDYTISTKLKHDA